jgi:hypothetical protein
MIAEEGVRLLAPFGLGDLRLLEEPPPILPVPLFVMAADPGCEGCGTANLNCTAGSGGWSWFAG